MKYLPLILLLASCGAEPLDMQFVLKADDLRSPSSPPFARYFALLDELEITGTAGLITESLETMQAEDIERLRKLHVEHQIWFHGHTHMMNGDTTEFHNTSIKEQRESFRRGLHAMCFYLSICLDVAFGAPGNGTDDNTIAVLSEFPQITDVFYAPDTEFTIPRLMDIEIPTHRPVSVGAFMDNLEDFENRGYEGPISLQLHPMSWTEEEWERVRMILTMLKARGASFVRLDGRE